MTQPAIKFEDLDLFKLLRLEHLNDQEKTVYGQKLLELCFALFASEDLPRFLTKEDLEHFLNLAKENPGGNESFSFLQRKIPNFEDLFKNRILAFKKGFVLKNYQERLSINAAAKPTVDQTEKKKLK